MNGFVSIFFAQQSNSKPTTIIAKIAKVKQVKFAYLVTGAVDAIAWVEAQDSSAFRDVLLDINSVGGVDHTSTFVAL